MTVTRTRDPVLISLTEVEYQAALGAIMWVDSHGDSEFSESLTSRERAAFDRAVRKMANARVDLLNCVVLKLVRPKRGTRGKR